MQLTRLSRLQLAAGAILTTLALVALRGSARFGAVGSAAGAGAAPGLAPGVGETAVQPAALDRASFAKMLYMVAHGEEWARQHASTQDLFKIIDTDTNGRIEMKELSIAEQDFTRIHTNAPAFTAAAANTNDGSDSPSPNYAGPAKSLAPSSPSLPPRPLPPPPLAPPPPPSTLPLPPPPPSPVATTGKRCSSSIVDSTQLYDGPSGCHKFVAVVAPVTTRFSGLRSTTRTAYATQLFGSVVDTLARSDDNKDLDLVFYIGYDAGDPVWDKPNAIPDLLPVVRSHISSKYAPRAGAYRDKSGKALPGLQLKAVRCESDSMVAASNCVISRLFEDGAEYWYRVNDDTTFVTTNWIRDFTNVLANFNPPNLGVVAPTCKQGNTGIMTYDFVHRTHWIVHGSQYPRVLKNWWCDDWVSFTYGKARTLKLPGQEVRHHVTITRYKVYAGDKQGRSVPKDLLPVEYKKSACKIDEWLRNNGFEDAPKTHGGKGKAACNT
jgi:hypothetical protein